jgi:nucleotide-binding universal stress UspA family protein
MSTILCPVDLSPVSVNAAGCAAAIAQTFGAELLLVHAEPAFHVELNHEDRKDLDSMESGLAHLSESLSEQYGIMCRFRMDHQELEEDIAEISRNGHISMIVMGTNGERALTPSYVGTNTWRVASSVRTVLLSIPANMTWTDPQHIVLAVDKPEEGKQHLLEVVSFARSFNADVTILHVDAHGNPMSDAFKAEVMGFFEQPDWLRFREIQHADVASALRTFMHEHKGHLLAVHVHHFSDARGMFHHSITRDMVEDAGFPVMIFH